MTLQLFNVTPSGYVLQHVGTRVTASFFVTANFFKYNVGVKTKRQSELSKYMPVKGEKFR